MSRKSAPQKKRSLSCFWWFEVFEFCFYWFAELAPSISRDLSFFELLLLRKALNYFWWFELLKLLLSLICSSWPNLSSNLSFLSFCFHGGRKVPETFRKGTLQWRGLSLQQSTLQRYPSRRLEGGFTFGRLQRGLKRFEGGLKGAWRGLEAFNVEGGFEGAWRGLQGGLKGAWPWRGLKGGFKGAWSLQRWRGLQEPPLKVTLSPPLKVTLRYPSLSAPLRWP